MKSLNKITSLFFSIIIVLSSCDIHEDDSKNNVFDLGDIDLYTTEGSPTLAYTRAYFYDFYEKDISFNLIEQPTNGTLDVLGNGEYLYYLPNENASSYNDELAVEVVSPNGEKLAKANIRIIPVTDCGKGPVTTHVTISNTESLQLNLMDNNIFCGGQGLSAGPFVVLDDTGNPTWDNYSDHFIGGDFNVLFSEENPGLVEYIPNPGFVGTETFYYCLSMGYKDGNMFADEFWLHPEWWTAYYNGMLVIEVTE